LVSNQSMLATLSGYYDPNNKGEEHGRSYGKRS